ncbi:hypothetical protein JJB07_07155 [Tumebacillus sp. ITR2]|uniref:Uncharacterized protein n=1 Tax=Tumebacillus amylolyticus TaxID=2801339 RepID=A0ABS1J808_9BACL|nr:hypothetical protein [Tumebacillus amylolyticus]MBL0386421.1 hypothetical protein [Tumebacillus amylolyticus]
MGAMGWQLQAFLYGTSIVAGILLTLLLRPSRKGIGILLGAIFADGFMFVGSHLLGLNFGPMIQLGQNETPLVVDVIFALIGAAIGVSIARAFKARS